MCGIQGRWRARRARRRAAGAAVGSLALPLLLLPSLSGRPASARCRHAGRLQLHAKYNCWEVAPPEGDRVDMTHEGRINRAEGGRGGTLDGRRVAHARGRLVAPAASAAPRSHHAAAAAAAPAGVDYYRAQLVVPENAYELNFVFSNGDGVFDNNANQVGGGRAGPLVGRCRAAAAPAHACGRLWGLRRAGAWWEGARSPPGCRPQPTPLPRPTPAQNYVLPVAGPMTRELWIETAPERAVSWWGRLLGRRTQPRSMGRSRQPTSS